MWRGRAARARRGDRGEWALTAGCRRNRRRGCHDVDLSGWFCGGAAHLFKRLPEGAGGHWRPGKGVVTVVVVAGVVLMVMGYRGVNYAAVWNPPAFLIHVNNLLMIFAVYLYAASGTKARHG